MTRARMPTAAVDPAEVVYEAERRSLRRLGAIRRFRSFEEAEQFVRALAVSQWWDEAFPSAPVEVEVHRRSRRASASLATVDSGVGVVALVDGRGWSLDVVLHELAHVAVGPGNGHSERFRRALVALWRHEAGVEAAAVLAAELGIGLP